MGMKRATRPNASAKALAVIAALLYLPLAVPAHAQNDRVPRAAPASPAAPPLGAHSSDTVPGDQQSPPPEAGPSGAAVVGAGAEAPAAAPTTKPKKKRQAKPAPPPRETALSDDPTPMLQAETFAATSQASERYGAIADAGGWPKVPVGLKPGAAGTAVKALRKRLAAEGDLPEGEAHSAAWDSSLTAAVKRFQFRMGLAQTGFATGATLRELNIPAWTRFRQLASSALRRAGVEFPFGERYVVVNIPAAAVEAIEGDKVVRRYAAIVGDVDHRSPEVEAKINAINFNPTWTVPTSIIKNELIPKMQKDRSYLSRAHIRMLDGRGRKINPRKVNWSSERAANYTFRQDPGTKNSLGSLRISMPNKHAVYMHDTPAKKLFERDYRFLSHGCVRVEGVYDLAAWLLEGAPGSPRGHWDKEAILAKIAEGERKDVRLLRPVPVIWVYMTGWASADGTVHFRDDTYGVDAVGDAQVER